MRSNSGEPDYPDEQHREESLGQRKLERDVRWAKAQLKFLKSGIVFIRAGDPAYDARIAQLEDEIAKSTQSAAPARTTRSSGSPVPIDSGGESRIGERRALRDAYKLECSQRGVKVTDEMIAQAANPKWSSRDAVQKWIACDPRYNGAHDARIRQVFIKKPHLSSH